VVILSFELSLFQATPLFFHGMSKSKVSDRVPEGSSVVLRVSQISI